MVVLWVDEAALVDGAALRGGFPDELVVVVDDAFEVISAIIEFPQLLIDRCLIMQNIYYQLFIDILA